MSAKQTVFTHFSQRYNKIPPLEEFEVEAAQNCCIAFDHMFVTPKTLGTVRLTYPALKIMFQDELFEMSKKHVKKVFCYKFRRSGYFKYPGNVEKYFLYPLEGVPGTSKTNTYSLINVGIIKKC